MPVTAVSEPRTADQATELITAFATADAGDPARPVLRERAIEGWLRLAQHLARR